MSVFEVICINAKGSTHSARSFRDIDTFAVLTLELHCEENLNLFYPLILFTNRTN